MEVQEEGMGWRKNLSCLIPLEKIKTTLTFTCKPRAVPQTGTCCHSLLPLRNVSGWFCGECKTEPQFHTTFFSRAVGERK